MLPGAFVFPEDAPVRHIASPRIPTTTVVRADPNVLRTRKAPAPQRVVVRRIYVPAARSVPSASVVRYAPARSTPSTKPRRRTSPPSEPRLTPLAATPSRPTRAKKPKKPKKDEQRSQGKKKDDGEDYDEEEYDDDKGDDRDDGDEDDDDRGDDSIDG